MPDTVIVRPAPQRLVVVQTVHNTVKIISAGPQGPPGPPGPSGAHHEHLQSSPSSEWIVNHNLGYYPVAIVIIDDRSTGDTVRHTSINSFSVDFASPQTGRVEYT